MALPPVLVLVAIIATLSSVCPQALLSCMGEMEPGGACLNYWIKHLSMRWALNNEILWLMIVLWHITKLFIFAFLWNLSHLPHTVCCTHTEVHEESIKACPVSLSPVPCTWLTSQLVLLLYSSGTSSRIFSRSYSGFFSSAPAVVSLMLGKTSPPAWLSIIHPVLYHSEWLTFMPLVLQP